MPLLTVAIAAGGFLAAPMAGNGAISAIMARPTRLEVKYEAVAPVMLMGRQKVASAALTADFTATGYRIAANGKAESLIDWITGTPSFGIVSTGLLTPLGLYPGRYDSFTRNGKKDRHVIVDFAPDDVAISVSPKFGDWGFPQPTQDQKLEASDPLTAIAELTLRRRATPTNPCGGPMRIFDGRQRYDLVLTFAGRLNWKSGAYKGPAIKCSVEYVEIAGFKNKSAEQRAKDRGDLAWANLILAELDNGAVTPPLKLEARLKSRGKMTIEATKLRYGPTR
ncbi:MAG TPA: DUF3108 domain-containing protein [Hyphomonadaceae bacterium]|nr:DUF3108 domain-containing protein [Hyphomonadaceae bacterium]